MKRDWNIPDEYDVIDYEDTKRLAEEFYNKLHIRQDVNKNNHFVYNYNSQINRGLKI